jgi:hypothetical protein
MLIMYSILVPHGLYPDQDQHSLTQSQLLLPPMITIVMQRYRMEVVDAARMASPTARVA